MCSQRSWALWSAAGPPSPGSDNAPMSAYSRYFTSWSPFSFWSQMQGLDHGRFSLEGSRMHLEMDTAEPAGPGGSPALWILKNNKQNNTQAMVWVVPPPQPAHGARNEPAQRSPGQVGKGGGGCIWNHTKGSRAALTLICLAQH